MAAEDRSETELADAYFRCFRLLSGTRAERKALALGEPEEVVAADRAVRAAIDRGGVEALLLVEQLLAAARNEDDVALVAAGPLEDLVSRHGVELVDEIERRARQNPLFAEALGGVVWELGRGYGDVKQRLAPWVRTFRD